MDNNKYQKIRCNLCNMDISKTNITHHNKSNRHIKKMNGILEAKKREIINKFSLYDLQFLLSMTSEQFNIIKKAIWDINE